MTGTAPDVRLVEVPEVDGSEPVLVVADGWLLDELAEARLRLQLARAEERVIGVAAGTGDLEPGDSYLSSAARHALDPLDVLVPAEGGPVQGAVLLRPGMVHAVDDTGIHLPSDEGTVLVDRGAQVHDPWRPVAPLGRATDTVRPSFPRRPVVLFIGLETDLDVADWARGMVNDLIRQGVDARFAVAESPDGLHLSRPCLPEPSVIDALAPHVVVTLDDAIKEVLDGWWGANRTSMVIDHTPDMTLGVELVSWQLGRSEGRVRARVGAVAKAAELAAVIDRLCGGPQPLPPPDDPPVDAETDAPTARETVLSGLRPSRGTARGAGDRATRTIVAVDGSGAEVDRHLAGLLDRLDAAGAQVERHVLADRLPDSLASADDVLLHRTSPTDDVLALVARRREADRPTIVDLTVDDLVADEEGAWRLHPGSATLTSACGRVLAPSRAAAGAVRERATPRLVVPHLIDRAHDRELRSLRAESHPLDQLTLGWHLEPDADPGEVAIAASALVRLLGDEPELRLVIVGRADQVELPDDLGPRIERLASGPEAWVVNHWTAQLWSAGETTRLSGDLGVLVDAGVLGVPTIISAAHPARDLLLHPAPLVVRRPDEIDTWLDHLRPVMTEEGTRLRRSIEVMDSTDAFYGPATSALVVERVLGWLARESHGG